MIAAAVTSGVLTPAASSVYVPKPMVDYSAGALAGMACVAVGHPWDSVKTRMQASTGPSTSAFRCFTSTLQREGVRGLYLGLSPRLLGGAAEAAVLMGVYQGAMSRMAAGAGPSAAAGSPQQRQGGPLRGLPGPVPEPLAVPVAGGVAGAAVSLVLGPSELIKCRMQVNGAGGTVKYSGPMHCFRHLLATEGMLGMTRGLGATMAREVPGNIVYFSTYRILRGLLPGKPDPGKERLAAAEELADAASAIVCGGLAGMALWGFVMPIDVAKTRIQTSHGAGSMGIMRTLRGLRREGGMAKLYVGMSPALARAFPANAAQWLVFELVSKNLRPWTKKPQTQAERLETHEHAAVAIAGVH